MALRLADRFEIVISSRDVHRRPHRMVRSGVALALGAALAVGLGAGRAQATRLTEVRIGSHAEYTRVVLELDQLAGYRLERSHSTTHPALTVDIDATSSARVVRSRSALVRAVRVEPSSGGRTVVRIELKKSGVKTREMILRKPPRIVLDLRATKEKAAPSTKAAAPGSGNGAASEGAAAAAATAAAPTAGATAVPSSAESTGTSEKAAGGGPSPAGEPEAAAESSAPTSPASSPSPEASSSSQAGSSPSAPQAIGAGAETSEAPAAPEAAPGETSPASGGGPETQSAAPTAPPEGAVPPERPSARNGTLLDELTSPTGLWIIAAAVLLLFFVWLRLRHRGAEPAVELPAPESVGEGEAIGAGASAMETGASGSGGAEPIEPPLEPDLPVAFGPKSAAAPSGDDTGAGHVAELERRLGRVETRLEEILDFRERLERQIAAQTEELRVQRAAIARTQRVVRSMTRPEDVATEPVPRPPGRSGD